MYPGMYLYKRIVQAKLYIDAHYAEAIDLDNIADEALFSKFHFTRLFRSIYGQTPHQYRTRLRIEKAKQLLQSGVSVTGTCFDVGFESLGSFNSLFKREAGQNPSAYRQQSMKRIQAIKKAPLCFIPACFAEQKGWVKNSNFEEVNSR
jgi:AraC-like DNA-binding protein